MKLDDERLYQVAAGIAGAVVFAAFEEGTTLWKRVALAFGGASASIFLTPPLCDALGPANPHTVAAMSFILGLMGMSISRSVIKFGQQRSDSVVGSIFTRLFGPPK